MAFGLEKLATSIEAAGSGAPGWFLEALRRADQDDVLKRLVADASSGVNLGFYVEEIPVKLFGRKLFTIGPFWMRLTGWDKPPEGKPHSDSPQSSE